MLSFLGHCSPQERRIRRNSIKSLSPEYDEIATTDEIEDIFSSPETMEEIEEEILQNSTKTTDSSSLINSSSSSSSTSNLYGDDFGDPVFIAKSCPPESASSYCRNGGTCFAQYHTQEHFILFCKCAPGWDGRQCQHTYNPKLYESAQVAADVQNASVISYIIVILVGLIAFSGLVFLSRAFCKAHDLRDYMYSESSIDPTTMTPVQIFPFSQRSSPSSSSSSNQQQLSIPFNFNTVSHQQQQHQVQQERNSQITLNYYNHFPYP